MSEPTFYCKDEQRRYAVRAAENLNGLDYLEVEIHGQEVFLCVHFLGPVPSAPEQINVTNIRIEGGQRIRDIKVVDVKNSDEGKSEDCLKVQVDKLGDFSTYTLRLVDLDPEKLNIDPRYAQLPIHFRAGCPSDLDCKQQPICPPEEYFEPEINYLAKDYASFRQLILDRLALLMPDWQERHVPDLGITLVELLAYVGDHLSYYQDAVATEAYLDTARQRISVHRHVRLVDYPMHEGCNARTWIWLETSQDTEDPPLKLKDVYFITRYPNAPTKGTVLTSDDLRGVSAKQYEVFEPIFSDLQAELKLYQAHNKIRFYTWGDRQCCLPKGATTATLRDEWVKPPAPRTQPSPAQSEQVKLGEGSEGQELPKLERKLQLKEGDILIFEEVKGAKTGKIADADPTRRHPVRLTKVEPKEDSLFPYTVGKSDRPEEQKTEGVTQELAIPLVEIEWAVEDALPFPLCISAIGPAPECALIPDISVARGNVLLADHGRTLASEDLGTVKEKTAIALCEEEEQPADMIIESASFQPSLKQAPLTFRQPISAKDLDKAPASRLLIQSPRKALPQITTLVSIPPDYQQPIDSHDPPEELKWRPQRDLLRSNSQEQHFVVEMDDEGVAYLRFGDGELGRQPDPGTQFFATYRVGSGTAGNIGAETLSHVVYHRTQLSGITLQPHNPFPAQGGTLPEPLSEVKLYAPHSFRQELQRAITAQDYADIVMRDFPERVQRAAATLCWTGSWYEVLVAIDPRGTETANEKLLEEIDRHLYRYRRMGHDVVVKSAVYVFLDIALTVCVQPDYLRGHVKAALLKVFSNRLLPDGRHGFFHPDNLTFGVGVALSQLVAIAQAVAGVASVKVTRLQRFGEGDKGELDSGILPLSSLEIARLDNDPNFPENGKFELTMGGGR